MHLVIKLRVFAHIIYIELQKLLDNLVHVLVCTDQAPFDQVPLAYLNPLFTLFSLMRVHIHSEHLCLLERHRSSLWQLPLWNIETFFD